MRCVAADASVLNDVDLRLYRLPKAAVHTYQAHLASAQGVLC